MRAPAVVQIRHFIASKQDRFRSFVESVALMVLAPIGRLISSTLVATIGLEDFLKGGWLQDDSTIFSSLGQTLDSFRRHTILGLFSQITLLDVTFSGRRLSAVVFTGPARCKCCLLTAAGNNWGIA